MNIQTAGEKTNWHSPETPRTTLYCNSAAIRVIRGSPFLFVSAMATGHDNTSDSLADRVVPSYAGRRRSPSRASRCWPDLNR
jgi:hypothetical protein